MRRGRRTRIDDIGDMQGALSDSLLAQSVEPFDNAINSLCHALQVWQKSPDKSKRAL